MQLEVSHNWKSLSVSLRPSSTSSDTAPQYQNAICEEMLNGVELFPKYVSLGWGSLAGWIHHRNLTCKSSNSAHHQCYTHHRSHLPRPLLARVLHGNQTVAVVLSHSCRTTIGWLPLYWVNIERLILMDSYGLNKHCCLDSMSRRWFTSFCTADPVPHLIPKALDFRCAMVRIEPIWFRVFMNEVGGPNKRRLLHISPSNLHPSFRNPIAYTRQIAQRPHHHMTQGPRPNAHKSAFKLVNNHS